MSLIVSDPTLYFVFEYPKGFLPIDDTFHSIHSNPYLVSSEWSLDFEISRFCLPFNFHSEPIYKEGIDSFLSSPIPDEYILEYEHTLIEMTEFDVNTAFLKRALEYYDYDMDDKISNSGWFTFDYLDFHYSKYHYDLIKWLDYVSDVIKDINKYIKIPQLTALKFSKLVNEWIVEKRKELAELKGEIIEQQPIVEVEDNNDEIQLELEMSGHKIVFLKELGVIDFLKKVCKTKNPSLNDSEFSKLVAPIIGIKSETLRKGLSGYGLKAKDDPKSKDALNKVKSELFKFGIEL